MILIITSIKFKSLDHTLINNLGKGLCLFYALEHQNGSKVDDPSSAFKIRRDCINYCLNNFDEIKNHSFNS